MANSRPTRIVAIGDVHGEAELLRRLLHGLDALAGEVESATPVYFLGDIVDRGPQSRQALDIVEETLARRPGSRMLLGNHDEWFLHFLQGDLDAGGLDLWLHQGGAETLLSYGCQAYSRVGEMRRHIDETRPSHRRILSEASMILIEEGFAFVHAGVDPVRPVDGQDRQDCVWIRDPFLNHVSRLSHTIVHGHTPQENGLPVVTENRVSMDTGAVFTGILSAVVVDVVSGDLRFYRTTADCDIERIDPSRLDRGLGTVLDR